MPNWNVERLPLLRTFKAILEEGSVVGASMTLGVTQSAVSKHLSHLRLWLADELFVRTADGMQPTPRALELHDRIALILDQADQLTNVPKGEPKDFQGDFAISATDEILLRILPKLVEKTAKEAPNLRVATLPLHNDYSLSQLERGKVNLVIAVNWHSPEQLKQRRLFRDHFVCIMRKDHPYAGQKLTLGKYVEAAHVLVAPLGFRLGAIDHALTPLGYTRRLVVSVPSFSMITPDLLSDDKITTVPSRTLGEMQSSEDFVVKKLPFEMPMIDYYALWHPRFDKEPKTLWVKDLIGNILATS